MIDLQSAPSNFNLLAVEGVCPPGAKGIAPGAGQDDTGPDRHPL